MNLVFWVCLDSFLFFLATPLLALTGDMGWKSAQFNRHIKMIKYWKRLINMDYNRLTKKVFLYDKSLCVQNWSSEIKYLCNNVDLNEDFNLIDINTEEFLNKTADKLKLGLSQKPKLRTYVKFKNTFTTEQYTKHCNSTHKRSLLAQFRMGILPIAIETGRFKGLTENERICKFCPHQAVENEQHFLCTCSLYTILRNSMYNNVCQRCIDFLNMNDGDKFYHRLTNEWRETANFIDKAWCMRTQKLYLKQ